MSKHTFTVVVAADADQDDCLAAAEESYVTEHKSLKGYNLSARWTDETRETVTLSVPAWHAEAIGLVASA